jgi:hypothetical protein
VGGFALYCRWGGITLKKITDYLGYGLWLLLAAACLLVTGLYKQWYDLPKFQDVTMEFGSEMPALTAFLTEDARQELAFQVSETPDVSKPGEHYITFRHSAREETVKLTIRDTVAPTAVFQDVSCEIGAELKPEDFVLEASDLSDITISFAQPLTVPESYGDAAVEIIVEDASGNRTTGQCQVYYVWMYRNCVLELGETLTAEHLLMDPQRDAHLLDQSQLDAVNNGGVGEYTVTSTDGDQTCTCTVTVQDTTPPTLELKSVAIYPDERVKMERFIESFFDLSGEVKLRLVTELVFDKMGTQTVVIEAEDLYGNVTTAETTLRIVTDTVAPSFSGMSDMSVKKHATPDYHKGISAYDKRDGTVSFTVDTSRVDTSKAGTYYAIYTAYDRAGNKATFRRKVIVEHDAEDTAALVKSIASTLPNDPEAIRDYVRSTISYSTNWGGSDPVWYGFKNKTGNCYVHALCLQRLLTAKGYTTQLIWVNHIRNGKPSHYWLIINMGGYWRHIDATPSTMHGRYSLMTDAQRYETLVSKGIQRDWDRDKWPACV